MADKSEEPVEQRRVELTTDFLGENRHEFVSKIAYQFWQERGRPFGSPDVDWFAAEQAVYSSLVASGLISPSANDPRSLASKIYSE